MLVRAIRRFVIRVTKGNTIEDVTSLKRQGQEDAYFSLQDVTTLSAYVAKLSAQTVDKVQLKNIHEQQEEQLQKIFTNNGYVLHRNFNLIQDLLDWKRAVEIYKND